MTRLPQWIVLALAFVLAPLAHAHKASDAYLTLERDGVHVSGRLDLALRDLDAAIDLDRNGDGEITWGELRASASAVESYALERLALRSGGAACPLTVAKQEVDRHTDGAYVVLELAATCASDGPTLAARYDLFFDIDPQHRGLVQFVAGGAASSVVFAADRRRLTLGGDGSHPLAQFALYVREGVSHIWHGYDHILFLVSLLLPAVLVLRGRAFRPAAAFGSPLAEVARVVTAFTAAHSITLTVAALGLVMLPSRLVESAIALSVVLAALNNLRPVVAHGRSVAAFVFGLVHGFGFAGALADLGLPSGALALSLAGFNIGVELGQLAIVAVFLPPAYMARATRGYALVLRGGSAVIAAVAAVWLAERALDLPITAAIGVALAR